MEQKGYRIRTMGREDLDFALELANQEGWNPGLADAKCFYQADPDGFFVGEVEGEPIGCISAVSYGEKFGFIGLYIVAPPHRGRGYGLQLWRHAMQYLKGHNIGLDGVVAQQDNYRKSGFKLAHRNVRYAGRAEAAEPVPQTPIVPAATVPFERLAAYDRTAFPAGRDRFLQSWLGVPGGTALAWHDGDTLSGYGVVRPCRQGFKVGPLFADTPEVAEALLRALIAEIPVGSDLFLDVPEPNTEAVNLARRHGMQPVFETARMYTGEDPALPLERIFGITTFELG